MEKFKIVSDMKPKGDQIKAIEKLSEGILKNDRFQTLLGVTGSGKTFTIANVIEKVQKPTLFIPQEFKISLIFSIAIQAQRRLYKADNRCLFWQLIPRGCRAQ